MEQHKHNKKKPLAVGAAERGGGHSGRKCLSPLYHNLVIKSKAYLPALLEQAARLAQTAHTPELRTKHQQLADYLAGAGGTQ